MIKTVCVYCASSNHINDVYNKDAKVLGTLLGKQGIRVVNGGGNMGLMRIVSDAVLSSGGTVSGIIPHFMVENEWYHPELTELIRTETMHERKKKMTDMADAIIALPGGYGTFEELLEVITWKQLGLYQKPVIILNTNNYYAPLLDMFRHAVDEKFMNEDHLKLWHIAQTPEEVMDMISPT